MSERCPLYPQKRTSTDANLHDGQARPTKKVTARLRLAEFSSRLRARIVEIALTKTLGKVALYRQWIINPDRKEILRDGRNRATIGSFRLVRGLAGGRHRACASILTIILPEQSGIFRQ
jgi:hypothetical protein